MTLGFVELKKFSDVFGGICTGTDDPAYELDGIPTEVCF